MTVFRKATFSDLDEMVRIGQEGKEYLKEQGIPQWNKGDYPGRNLFLSDIRRGIAYVAESDGKVAAVCALILGIDATYVHPVRGTWLQEGKTYAAIHRVAVSKGFRGKHISSFLFENAARTAKEMGAFSLRVDTHEQNVVMQGALKRCGFVYCTDLILADCEEAGDPRIGLELLL